MSHPCRPAALTFAALFTLSFAQPACADLFQMEWLHRWSLGVIHHETGLPDRDPDPQRAFYEDAVRDYDLDGHDELEYLRLVGSGGDLVVEDRSIECGGSPHDCHQRRVTFDFGAVFAGEGNPETFRLVMEFEPTSIWGRPTPRMDEVWSEAVDGVIIGSSGSRWGANIGLYPTRNARVATPVPEPSTLALAGVGAGLVAAAARRRRR